MTLSVDRPYSMTASRPSPYTENVPSPPSRNELVMTVLDNMNPSSRDEDQWREATNAANIGRSLMALKEVRRDNSVSMNQREKDMDGILQTCLTRGDYGKREWDEARYAFGQWYARAADFDASLENAIIELSTLRERHKTVELRELLEEYRGKVQMLSAAIRQHRNAFSEDHLRPCSPSEYDEELWALARIDLE
ncbi:MAG: hypothetical protein E6R04_08560 [Spirochaetes bacterium]|nr:MAG: hypothetical protein E6R04_08560 [Spirochaetota bacterium]